MWVFQTAPASWHHSWCWQLLLETELFLAPWEGGGGGQTWSLPGFLCVSLPRKGDASVLQFCRMWAVKIPVGSSEHVKNKGAVATLGWICTWQPNVIFFFFLMGKTEVALTKQCFSQSLSHQCRPWLVGMFFPLWRVLSLRWKWVNWVVLTNNSQYLWIWKQKQTDFKLNFPNAAACDSLPLSLSFLAPLLGREDSVLHQFCCPPSGSSSPSSRWQRSWAGCCSPVPLPAHLLSPSLCAWAGTARMPWDPRAASLSSASSPGLPTALPPAQCWGHTPAGSRFLQCTASFELK